MNAGQRPPGLRGDPLLIGGAALGVAALAALTWVVWGAVTGSGDLFRYVTGTSLFVLAASMAAACLRLALKGPGPAVEGPGGGVAPPYEPLEQRIRQLGVALQSPILVRELRALLRGRKFFASHMLLLTVLAGVLLIAATAAVAGPESGDPAVVGELLYKSFALGLSVVVIFLVPAFSCTAVTTERESKTLDLLLTTTIRPWEIVWGKLLGALTVILLFMASALPLVTICFLFGGISPWDLAILYTAVLFGTLVVSSVSLSVSAHCKESKSAVVISYVLTLIIVVILAVGLFAGLRAVSGRSGGGYFAAALAGYSGVEQLLIFTVPSFLGLSIFAVNFAAATNRLKPATANRSTNLRVTWFAFLVISLLLYAVSVLVEKEAGNLSDPDAWSTLPGIALAVGGPLLWLGALYFGSEEAILPPRVVEDGRRLEGPLVPLRIFMPGPLTGVAYTALVCLVALGGLCLFTISGASGASSGGAEVVAASVPLALFLLTAAATAAVFSSLGFTRRGAGLAAFGATALLVFGPLVLWLCQQAISGSDRGSAFGLCCLSPLVAAMSAWPMDFAPPLMAGGVEIPIWLVSAFIYACLAFLLWLLAVLWVWRRRSRWERDLRLAAEARPLRSVAQAQGLPGEAEGQEQA